MVLDINSSFYTWKMVKTLYFECSDRDIYTYRKFASILNVSRYNPVFNELIHYLIEEKIIVIESVKERTNFLKIRTQELTPLIEDSIWYEETADYIRKTRAIYANI